jgi:molybdate transport system substrate-binding protein
MLYRGALLIAFALAIAPGVGAQTLTVFAAASLKNALDELNGAWVASGHPAAVVAYGSSSALAKQIENGAPAAVFISADANWMNYLEQRGLLRSGSRINLVRNEIVLIAPADSAVSLAIGPRLPLAEALGSGRLAMADPDHVPAGKYGKAALEALGVWASVSSRIARGEDVRAALNFVARGEAPLGIVYRTDAAADTRVRIVGVFPDSTHPPIVYPAALVALPKGNGGADFLAFLKRGAARAIFRKHGFLTY